jgi:hypothetical protein
MDWNVSMTSVGTQRTLPARGCYVPLHVFFSFFFSNFVPLLSATWKSVQVHACRAPTRISSSHDDRKLD